MFNLLTDAGTMSRMIPHLAISPVQWMRSPYGVLDGALAKGCMTFTTRLPVMGSCLVTGDPKLIGEIARNPVLIGGRGTEALRPVVGEHSLIALEGERHRIHRGVLLPHFFSGNAATIDRVTRKWADALIPQINRSEVVNAGEFLTGITLHAIIELIFGEMPEKRHREAFQLIDAWKSSFRQAAILFLKIFHVNLGRLSPWGRFLANRARVHAFIRQRLLEVRHSPDGSVFSQIAHASPERGAPLSDDEIVSETVTFLLFGHDTTAASLAWTLTHLLGDEAASERAQLEVETVGDGPPESFPFLRAAIDESMRLCPVVVHLTRHAIADTRVGTHAVPRDTRVLPCMYLAHRNPQVFERADEFLPERFLVDSFHYRHAYFPFGLGERVCAGMPMALLQMVLLLGSLLRHGRFALADPARILPVRKLVIIVPSGGPLLRRID
ncbi:MAG TPA: cytochrome P450 [Accumulibacter sp.]|nr:cytochrome P450 [Accumulibacter sp.]HND79182.1 cytochrome P450 [Accumulibacter sp.]HNE13471.1 cytochrome P450 [Accumulibacter sp.]HNJ99554.1 cytochrome P450 [Accumulibacter sp.]HNL12701.1 cytochrome P450 [Accumulibacter sp.]